MSMTGLLTEHESATRTLVERQLLLCPNLSSDPGSEWRGDDHHRASAARRVRVRCRS